MEHSIDGDADDGREGHEKANADGPRRVDVRIVGDGFILDHGERKDKLKEGLRRVNETKPGGIYQGKGQAAAHIPLLHALFHLTRSTYGLTLSQYWPHCILYFAGEVLADSWTTLFLFFATPSLPRIHPLSHCCLGLVV